MDKRRRAADLDCRVTLGQDVWWRNRDGIYLLISRMDERYRHNCANWLMDRAAQILIPIWRQQEIQKAWGRMDGSPYGDHEIDVNDLPPARSFRDVYRARMDRGEHIDTMLAAPLYRAMAA